MRPNERVAMTAPPGWSASADRRDDRCTDAERTASATNPGSDASALVPAHLKLRKVGLLEAPAAGLRATGEALQGTVDGLGQIISGRRSVEELGGPLRIAKMSGETLSLGDALSHLVHCDDLH